ncbi:DnaD domain protein [Enterococcus hirae]
MNNYFPHDSNSRNSDKLLPVRMKFGAEGYGIYFMILERLRDEKNYMSVKDYNMLAFDLRVDAGKVKSIVEDFGLFAFTENGECFYSEGFNKRMEIKDEKSKKRSEAGKKGAEKRWQKNSNAIAKLLANDSKESKGNESKVKKSKKDGSSTTDKDLTSRSSAVSYWLNQVNPTEAPTILESIDFWVKDFNGQEDIVVTAIDEMLKNGAKSFKYLEKILKTWEENGLDSVEKVHNHLNGHYQKKAKPQGFTRKARREPIPEWLDDPEGYNKRKEAEYQQESGDLPF